MAIVVALFSVGSLRTFAETVTTGQVALIDGADEGGFAFRLVGFPQLCGAPATLPQYGVITASDGVTQEKIKYMLAMVMAAKLAGLQVTVYASPSPTNPGCAVRAIVW